MPSFYLIFLLPCLGVMLSILKMHGTLFFEIPGVFDQLFLLFLINSYIVNFKTSGEGSV
jgi:hypothetical protein